MAIDLLDIALRFLEQYGLVAVFILLVLDGAMLLPVLPGEIVMVMAVAQYADSIWDLGMLVALATAAAIVGSLMLYAFARFGGRPVIERHPKLFMMPRRRRERLERLFEKPLGQSLVLFLRIVPLTRVLVNIPAGLARMGTIRFLVLSTIGMLVFHAGFMWFAYEYGAAGGGVAEQAAVLQDAYASPAWEYMQANQVITALGLLAFGAVLSLRASRRILRDPEEGTGSLIGWLSARVLFWGGLAVGVGLWMEERLVFDLAAEGGLDIHRVAATYGWDPASLVAVTASSAIVLGFVLILLGRRARKRRRLHKLYDQQRGLGEEVERARRVVQARREAMDADGDDEDG